MPFNGESPTLKNVPHETARSAVDPLVQGGRVMGFTKGQFSLIDLIRAVIAKTGPAHVTLSTWTFGIRDIDSADWLAKRGDITGLTVLVDRSFPTRQPKYCAKLVQTFGLECIRCVRTHAKFALVRNGEWNVCIRSSMNLNRNARFEQFDLDDNAAMCDFVQEHVEEMFRLTPQGVHVPTSLIDDALNAAMGSGEHLMESELIDEVELNGLYTP